MADDGYIDRDYVRDSLGRGWIDAVASVASVELFIRQATANVRADVVALGYTSPAPGADFAELNTGTDLQRQTYDLLRAAVLGHVLHAASFVPEKRVKMPDNWERHPGVVAMERIHAQAAGDDRGVRLALPLDTLAAVGGVGISEARPTVTVSQGSTPARATRKNLAVW